LTFALLLAALLLFGFVPSLFTDKIKTTAQSIVEIATRKNFIHKADQLSTPAALQAVVK
jgi:hypothetical protein